ncbi:MAG: SPOR domain-containing protein [Balneolaceae bacterium]|nr:MAG: SPOR domain-containing protein [Balneolaceae bacterium]
MKKVIYISILILFVGIGCATTETVSEEPERPIFEIDAEIAEAYIIREEEMDEYELFLAENRSYLSDRFATLEQDIPDIFLREVAREEREIDPYAGFRVQILSTRSVAEADSVRDDFRAWANERLDGYEAEAYIYFRQPNYRVRTGDFRDRDTAIEFSRIVKNRYPEAWVVHDRIEPQNVPSDTTVIRLRERRELQRIEIEFDIE